MKYFSVLFLLGVSLLTNTSYGTGNGSKVNLIMQCSVNNEVAINIYETKLGLEQTNAKFIELKFIPEDNNKYQTENNGKKLVDETGTILNESAFVVGGLTSGIEHATGFKGNSISALLSLRDGKIILYGPRGSDLKATYSGMDCK